MQSTDSLIKYDSGSLSKKELKSLYVELRKPRLIEEKMLSLLRQGKISKWFSGIGQEAIAVGCTQALAKEEFIFTMHRNLGVFTSRDVPLYRLFAQWQGKNEGFTKGRDRSFHLGAKDYHIVGMISHLAAQLSLADGVALANKLQNENKACLAFTGEGATSEGEFHEALNLAAVWNLPVIFVIENNGYGLSTPVSEQYKCDTLASKGPGYGIRSMTIDGNNILEVYQTIRKLAKEIRKNPEPVLVECMTFRMRGHEEASGTKYVPKELMEYWAQRDPIKNYESYLEQQGLLHESEIQEITNKIKSEIDSELKRAYELPDILPDLSKELEDMYMAGETIESINLEDVKEKRFVDAISEALDQAMERHPDLVLMGQDIAEYGGVFKVTEGLSSKFGNERVRNTPLCESAIIGAALGLSIKGIKSMVEMQFADFVSCGFNQIVNNLAKSHYRWGQNADVVIRMPTGAGVAAGPFHSQSNEAWFAHVPGLKIIYPSNPHDAKGLLLNAFEDPNPVMYFEHKGLYRSISGPVSSKFYTIPFGQAALRNEGNELSIVTYGMGVHWALSTIEEMGLSADVLDLRTLVPLDYESIRKTVQKTNRVLVLHEDTIFGGIGGEISAWISEHLFRELDAPVFRCASLDTAVPFSKELEQQFLASSRLKDKINSLLNF